MTNETKQLTLPEVLTRVREALTNDMCGPVSKLLKQEALRQQDAGINLTDFLTQGDIMEALGVLGDVYVATGVKLPDNIEM